MFCVAFPLLHLFFPCSTTSPFNCAFSISMYSLRLYSLLPFVSLTFGSTIISPASRADLSSGGNSYPVSVVRASDSTAGFGFAHAKDEAYTATIYVNGVPFQVSTYTLSENIKSLTAS